MSYYILQDVYYGTVYRYGTLTSLSSLDYPEKESLNIAVVNETAGGTESCSRWWWLVVYLLWVDVPSYE